MKKIESDEIFRNLGEFLKAKGIELTQGRYSQAIQRSCGLLTDVINLSQEGLEKAKTGVEKKLDQMRQIIHEKTAPKPPPMASARPDAADRSGAEAGPSMATPASEKAERPVKQQRLRKKVASKPKRTRRGRGPKT